MREFHIKKRRQRNQTLISWLFGGGYKYRESKNRG